MEKIEQAWETLAYKISHEGFAEGLFYCRESLDLCCEDDLMLANLIQNWPGSYYETEEYLNEKFEEMGLEF